MNVSVSVETQQEEAFETIEVSFPIYSFGGYNNIKTTSRRGVEENEIDFKMRKLVSPTEYFILERNTSIKSDGEQMHLFEMQHHIESEPIQNRKWYLLKESTYDTLATKDDWDSLFVEFQAILVGFA